MDFVPKLDWENAPSTATPITAAQLIRMENGIAEGARDATELQRGNVELATAAEMTTGTDLTRVPSVKRVVDHVASVLAGLSYATTSYVLSAIAAPFSLIASAAGMVPLTIKGAISQTALLLQAKNSDDVVIAYIDANGQIGAGASYAGAGMLKALARTSSTPLARLRMASGQSGQAIILEDSAGLNKFVVLPDGTVNGANIGAVPNTSIEYVPLMVLDAAEAVPAETRVGTVVLRRPA